MESTRARVGVIQRYNPRVERRVAIVMASTKTTKRSVLANSVALSAID